MIWLLLAVAVFFQDINDNPTNNKTTKELGSWIIGFMVFLLTTQLILTSLELDLKQELDLLADIKLQLEENKKSDLHSQI